MDKSGMLDILYLIFFSVIFISTGATSTHIYGLDASLYIGLPSIISGIVISYFLRDIRLILITMLLTVVLLTIFLSIIYSLPALLGIISDEALRNAFIFISIKKAVYDMIYVIILIIPSSLVTHLIYGD